LFTVDFGVSSLNAKKAKTFVGTPYWMAPEIIESKNTLSGYGPEVRILYFSN
jgi:serine/threonine protein kinase